MKNIKNVFSIIFIIIFIFVHMIGCSIKDSKDKNYIYTKEEKIEMPEELYTIFKIIKQDDEHLAILGKDEKNNLLYFIVDSDFGVWEKKDLNITQYLNNDVIILDADLNYKENLVLQYIGNENEELILFDIKNSKFNNLNFDFRVNKVYIDENNNLILSCDEQDKLIYYDIENNNIIREYNDIMLNDISLLNDKLIASHKDTGEIISYDLKSNDSIRLIKDLSEYNNCIIFSEKNSDDIYFKADEGMYKYINNKTELLFDIDNTKLADSNIRNNKFIVLNNTIVSYGNYKDNEKSQIYKYYYGNMLSDNTKLKDSNEEFVIYSLYENDIIRNYVLDFKDKYPNKSIKYKYGISSDELIEEDAIEILNTELMAGKGPDILFLDNLNIDNYYERKILEDITDIVNDNESNLFTNIINPYKKGEKLYYIPTSFNIPIIMGENVSKINDLDSLISVCEKNIENEEKLFNIYSGEDIINIFYESVSNNILNDNKTLNIEGIKGILNKFKTIYDLTVDNLSVNEEKDSVYIQDFVSLYSLNKNTKINICSLNYYNQYLFINSIKDKYNCDYTFWNGENGEYFRGVNVVGINSNSKNKTMGKEFVNSLINGSYYNNEFNNLSINREVFINTLKDIKNYESGIAAIDENADGDIFKSSIITEEHLENIVNSIYSLNKAVNVNKIILEKIKSEMVNYIEGKSDIESTLNLIKNNLEIYLSE